MICSVAVYHPQAGNTKAKRAGVVFKGFPRLRGEHQPSQYQIIYRAEEPKAIRRHENILSN